jgi:hypothetical protein
MHTYTASNSELVPGALVECPTCGLPAEITDRFTLDGAPGPVEHVKVVCIRRHWYVLPVDMFAVSAPAHGQADDSDSDSDPAELTPPTAG